MSVLTLRLEPDLEASIIEIAREQQKSKSAVVRDLLRGEIAVQRLHRARAELMPYAERIGVLTDEDVFKLVS